MQPYEIHNLARALRNEIVGPSPLFAPGVATGARVTLATSANALPLPIATMQPGWWLFACRDAWVTLSQLDSRIGLDGVELSRSWRLGPASRIALPITEGTRFRYVCTSSTPPWPIDATTGLSTGSGTPTPQLTAWWAGVDRPPEDTRSGFEVGASALAARATISAAAPVACHPPGWARRLHVVASSAVILSILDGPDEIVVGELPASRDHVLDAIDPWATVQLSVAAGTADAWVSWGDR